MAERASSLHAEALCLIARTELGAVLARRLSDGLGGEIFLQSALLEKGRDNLSATPFEQAIACLRQCFTEGRPIVAILASGIVIRALADLLDDKRSEPPVVVVDETGSFAIPLLGGHRGANDLARQVAEVLGGTAAITTASEAYLNLNGESGTALDAPPFGWTLLTPREETRKAMGALIAGATAQLEGVAQEAEWLTPLAKTKDSKTQGKGTGGAESVSIKAQAWTEIIATKIIDSPQQVAEKSLNYGVGQLALGVGTSKNANPDSLIGLVTETLSEHKIPLAAISFLATWEGKRNEPAVMALAKRLGLGIYGLSTPRLGAEAEWLSEPSEEVVRALGIPGVAEAAALAALGGGRQAQLLVAKCKNHEATCSVAYACLSSETNLSALPASKVEAEKKGHGGVSVVGLGAGGEAWLTGEALRHLAACEAWVGYTGYLERLVTLFPRAARKRGLYGSSLGEERERAELTLKLAEGGKRVALVSSGDPGVYAMASPLFEALEASGSAVSVSVVAGISAVQAVAARVGAPIGHDFCCISLSDLLTSREDILRRVEAAAGADFVIAFYNPASRTRRDLLDQALSLIEQARGGAMEVVLAHAVGHKDEKITHTTLAELNPDLVDMRSLVLIGSSTTRRIRSAGAEYLYTPRGYGTAKRDTEAETETGTETKTATDTETGTSGTKESPQSVAAKVKERA